MWGGGGWVERAKWVGLELKQIDLELKQINLELEGCEFELKHDDLLKRAVCELKHELPVCGGVWGGQGGWAWS